MKDTFRTIIKHPFAVCAVIGAVTTAIVKIIEATKKAQ